jgi:hypothetical protein
LFLVADDFLSPECSSHLFIFKDRFQPCRFPRNGFLTRLSRRHVSLSVDLTCRTWVSRVSHSSPGIYFSFFFSSFHSRESSKNPTVKDIPPRQVSFMSTKNKKGKKKKSGNM